MTSVRTPPAHRSYDMVNPTTGEVVRTFDTLTDEQAAAALDRADAAFRSWRPTPVTERVRLFRRIADLIDANAGEPARLTTLEMGKPLVQSMRVATPDLVLGNTVLLRPSEISAGSTTFLGGLFAEAGFPADVFQTEKVADESTARFAEAFTGQKVGDPFDPGPTVGPLSSATAADQLQTYQDALDKGATDLVPGGRLDGPGAFFRPAAITDVTPEMRVYSEEAFGPLAMIYRVPDRRRRRPRRRDQHLLRRPDRGAVRRHEAVRVRAGAGALRHGRHRRHHVLRDGPS